MSETCLREFPELEYYMCLACNENQPKYVNEDTKVIYVCNSFAKKLWTDDPTVYDKCGLKMPKITGPASGHSGQFILPSRYYPNASLFLNDLIPPYFGGYKVEIKADGEDCMNSFGARAVVSSLVAIFVAMITADLL